MKKHYNYLCKIATLEEIKKYWDQEIENNSNPMYKIARIEDIEEIKQGTRIPYIGIYNDEVICRITAIINPEGVKNEAQSSNELVNKKRCFLCAIKTKIEYENNGYFKKLLQYTEKNLQEKGFEEISLAVDQKEKRNIEIYKHLGYIHYIRTEINRNYIFDYYYKELKNNS